jgi:dTDP-glucose pyrophosphorylase
MMTFPSDTPESCGIVELDDRGIVRAFYEKVSNHPGRLANGAVYILEPSVLEFLQNLKKEMIDFSTEVLPHYLGRIATFYNDVYHRDIGNLASYEAALKEFSAKIQGEGRSMTVVVPALNEEGNLADTIRDIIDAMGDKFESHEIIIINDGSTDRTGAIADEIARKYPFVRVKHHRKNRGLGYSVSQGYRLSKKEYVMWYPGDNGMKKDSLAMMFAMAGKADMIIPYIQNTVFRSMLRRIASRLYINMLNMLFILKLKYFNGVIIYKTQQIQSVRAYTHGFASFAEVVIRLIKAGATYLEVPTCHQERGSGESKALRMSNFVDIARTFTRLIWELHVLRKSPLNGGGQRRQSKTCRQASTVAQPNHT